MTVWIVTTGSSDIKLKNPGNWPHLYRKVKKKLNNLSFPDPKAADYEEYAKAPARVLGLMYANLPDYYKDLVFPLLENFSKKLEQYKPTKIILLLTNQEDIFSDIDKRLIECPYWQDTVTLEPLFQKYLSDKFPRAQKEYLELKPEKGSKGLEHWDSMLKLVQDTLSKSRLDVNKTEAVYVSHQAGTQAISSAVQFVTLGKFGKKAKFLVGKRSLMFSWICVLEPQFEDKVAWALLKWWGKEKDENREHEDDVRNQLLHNLCG